MQRSASAGRSGEAKEDASNEGVCAEGRKKEAARSAERMRSASDWCSARHCWSHCLWKEGSSCSTNHSSFAIASKKLIAFLYCSWRM